MLLRKSLIETMTARKSVRTYDTQPVSEASLEKIQTFLGDEGNYEGPFGKIGRIELVRVTKNQTDKGIKLGTYGFIKNPQAYLVGVTENNKYDLIGFAYVFHKLVLYLTELDLGTCWMGGTFNRNSFERQITVGEQEFIPCITPIGYPREKQRIFDKALRYAVKADNKKTWDKLFFDESFENRLEKENAEELALPIEMVRVGPSASNKQPWRLLVSPDRRTCHFYIEHTPNYSSSLGYDMQLLDMGIAMCQFELACIEEKIKGEWSVEDPLMELPNEQYEYIVSWKTN